MPRFERILFPVDFSERSRAAAPFVLSMAQRHKSKVVLIHGLQPLQLLYAGMNTVYPEVYDFAGLPSDLRAELEKFAEAELPGVDVASVVETGDPAAVIGEYARNENISLIMMPTHGYGAFRRALLGSVTAKVLHDASVPVWTAAHAPEASHRAHPQPRHILCAVDLKSESPHILEFAVNLAAETKAARPWPLRARENALHAYSGALRYAPGDPELRQPMEAQIERVSSEPLDQIRELRDPFFGVTPGETLSHSKDRAVFSTLLRSPLLVSVYVHYSSERFAARANRLAD